MATIHNDLGNILTRVEAIERRVGSHKQVIKELKGEVNSLKMEQRELAYKMKDQKNRSRRKKFRIRGLPESISVEELAEKMKEIFNPILGREEEAQSIRIEKVHRIRRPNSISMESPRDIIIIFQNYEVKTQIWGNMKSKSPIKYESVNLQIFQDLSYETLRRRRLLKPSWN